METKIENNTRAHKRKEHCVIAESALMQKVLSDVAILAKSNCSVFIHGESGTGKEVIAHLIHRSSSRAHHPFIQVNCAAIPATLLESEFFGHEKGSFTGAMQRKAGRFERAHNGTLLLDEVSEIAPELQPKLLRAVQEMEFERVGGVYPVKVDVRILSTSNRSFQELLEKKLFREDLYYRLNVIPLHLAPLRERKADILPLARHFLKTLSEENAKPLLVLSPAAEEKLLHHPWPGNVRELANLMERLVVMATSLTIETKDIAFDPFSSYEKPPPSLPIGITLAEVEKQMILATLAKENQHRNRAAQILGITPRTLRNKLRKL